MVSTYSEAGVDIDASEKATEALIAQIKNVGRKGDGEAIKLDNGFAGLVKLGTVSYTHLTLPTNREV